MHQYNNWLVQRSPSRGDIKRRVLPEVHVESLLPIDDQDEFGGLTQSKEY